ncbi:MAG: hypothetical protein IK106_03115 [Clostridiales bacterium]|nr:hypothetical protein [Clostridiales bacterium]
MHKFKRLGSLGLAAVCMLSMAGCGKKKEESKSSKDDKTATVTETTKDTEEESENTEKTEEKVTADPDMAKHYERTSNLKLFALYMNYHNQRQEDQFGHGNCYDAKWKTPCIPVLVQYDEEIFGKKFDGSLKDVFDLYNNGDIFEAASRCTCLSTPARYDQEPIIIELDSSEEIKVNEFDTVHFKGHASGVNHVTNEPLNFYVTGYTFIFEGEPYMLVGIIYGEDGEDLRAEIDKEIDYMMTTVRTEK